MKDAIVFTKSPGPTWVKQGDSLHAAGDWLHVGRPRPRGD